MTSPKLTAFASVFTVAEVPPSLHPEVQVEPSEVVLQPVPIQVVHFFELHDRFGYYKL